MLTNPNVTTALITGARSGLGHHLAHYWLSQGLFVIGCSRERSELQHPSYRHIQADVSEEQSVKEMFLEVRKAYGGLDILINNAGILTSAPALLVSSQAAEKVMRTNFHGTFLCSREAVPLMKRNRFGRIVNISSISVLHAMTGNAIYGASKAAIEHFTKVLAKEVVGYGITVNTLGLPPVEGTGMVDQLNHAAVMDAIEKTLLKRLVTLDEAAGAISFFASAESGAITGQILYLGGC